MNSQHYSSKPGRPRNHSSTRFSPPEGLGYVATGGCVIFNLNPIRKIYDKNDIPFFSNKFQKLSPYLSGKSRAKCKW